MPVPPLAEALRRSSDVRAVLAGDVLVAWLEVQRVGRVALLAWVGGAVGGVCGRGFKECVVLVGSCEAL